LSAIFIYSNLFLHHYSRNSFLFKESILAIVFSFHFNLYLAKSEDFNYVCNTRVYFYTEKQRSYPCLWCCNWLQLSKWTVLYCEDSVRRPVKSPINITNLISNCFFFNLQKGGGTIDLEHCLTYTSTIEPTLAPQWLWSGQWLPGPQLWYVPASNNKQKFWAPKYSQQLFMLFHSLNLMPAFVLLNNSSMHCFDFLS
jgi:hypothetical protein